MVFDNADDLLSVPISKYFPVVPWGHILITSRDQDAIGAVAEEGSTIGPLAIGDAIAVLLERADIRQPWNFYSKNYNQWRKQEPKILLLASVYGSHRWRHTLKEACLMSLRRLFCDSKERNHTKRKRRFDRG
jgi:hypothetical protein